MDEYIKTHTIKNMDDMQEMIRNMFGPALQKMLDAVMEAKLGYAKNEKNDTTNSRNGYYANGMLYRHFINSHLKSEK